MPFIFCPCLEIVFHTTWDRSTLLSWDRGQNSAIPKFLVSFRVPPDYLTQVQKNRATWQWSRRMSWNIQIGGEIDSKGSRSSRINFENVSNFPQISPHLFRLIISRPLPFQISTPIFSAPTRGIGSALAEGLAPIFFVASFLGVADLENSRKKSVWTNLQIGFLFFLGCSKFAFLS